MNIFTKVKNNINGRVFHRIRKWRNTRKFLKRKEAVLQAKGEILENLKPFILRNFDEAVGDYFQIMGRKPSTIQASHDIRRFLDMRLTKSFTESQK